MRLSVIIPVYNEAATVEQVIRAVRLVPIEKEIIIVDGESNDGTREILEREDGRGDVRVIFQTVRNGRGGALVEGLKAASGDFVVFQDADLELDPECFPRLLAPLVAGQAEVVLGSRFLTGKPTMTPLQYWGNRAVTAFLNALWGTRLTDVETCYQMFPRSHVARLRFDRSDMSFTIELLLRLVAQGYQIVEVPVPYTPRGHDEGKKLYWGDGFVSLWVVLKYRFLLKRSVVRASAYRGR